MHLRKTAPRSKDRAVESFLHDLEKSLTDYVMHSKFPALSDKDNSIRDMEKALKRQSCVVVPTDKTNSVQLVPLEDYIDWLDDHLTKSVKVINRSRVVDLEQQATQRLTELQSSLSKKEFEAIKESIDMKEIPTPKLLVKDHKKRDATTGNYPTRLIVPAGNFTVGFSCLGYLAIKNIFDNNNIDYGKHTIVQASHLKQQLESLQLKKDDVTIASMDVKDMYPSIKYDTVQKAIDFYASKVNLSEMEQKTINTCLDAIKFGMASTLICVRGEYYEYDGDKSVNDKGLTIGGFPSAWLADICAAFILENAEDLFVDLTTRYKGIYRDDGILIANGNVSKAELVHWYNRFQQRVNNLTGDDSLQFTMVIWGADKDDGTLTPNVTVDSKNYFPYLDTALYWSETNHLQFRVYLKPNQKLKYLNKGSSHPPSTFKSVSIGVFKRLARLTSVSDSSKTKKINEIYPHHAKALQKAGLAPTSFPTLEEILA